MLTSLNTDIGPATCFSALAVIWLYSGKEGCHKPQQVLSVITKLIFTSEYKLWQRRPYCLFVISSVCIGLHSAWALRIRSKNINFLLFFSHFLLFLWSFNVLLLITFCYPCSTVGSYLDHTPSHLTSDLLNISKHQVFCSCPTSDILL